MTEIKLNNNMFEKSSDVSEKSPFLKPDDYVKVLNDFINN